MARHCISASIIRENDIINVYNPCSHHLIYNYICLYFPTYLQGRKIVAQVPLVFIQNEGNSKLQNV